MVVTAMPGQWLTLTQEGLLAKMVRVLAGQAGLQNNAMLTFENVGP